MTESLVFWSEPQPPAVDLPELPYREDVDMHRALQEADRLVKLFDDLDAVIHMALIHALEGTAAIQNAHPAVGKSGYPYTSFKPEPHDGFYTYRGSMDTSWVAEFITIAVRRWIAYQAEKNA